MKVFNQLTFFVSIKKLPNLLIKEVFIREANIAQQLLNCLFNQTIVIHLVEYILNSLSTIQEIF